MDKDAIGETQAVQPSNTMAVKPGDTISAHEELELRVDRMGNLLAQTVSQVVTDGKRVDELEKMVKILSSEAGHKPGDEDIPF